MKEASATNSPNKRLAVITGGNKGIGLEICRELAVNGIRVILTARDEKKGTKAVEQLNFFGLNDVLFHQLDVKDPLSIASLAKFIETNFNKLDILVNNAGEMGIIMHVEALRAFKLREGFVTDAKAHLLGGIIEEPHEMAHACLETNYYGTKRVTKALLPLLQLSSSARIVNVSSVYGQLSNIYNEKVKAELTNLDNLTEEKIDAVSEWFKRDLKAGNLKINGWPITSSAYKVSKALINAYTRLVAMKYPNMLINCVHPGSVNTDLTCNMGSLTAKEGARAPVMVALLPDDGPSGVYFDQMRASTF